MMDKCPSCGAETRPGDNYCLNCGNRLTPSTPSPQQAQPAPGKETWTLWQLQRQLQSKNAGTRRQAAEQLGQSKDERAVEALIAALRREARNWRVGDAVANALITLGDARVVPALVEVLQHDQDVFVQELAAETLMKIEGVQSLEVLVLVLQAGGGAVGMGVRGAAAWALGEMGDARAVEPLIAALQSNDKWEVLCTVAQALGKIGGAQAIEVLARALRGAEDVVQRSAAEALGETGDPRAVEPLVSALRETTYDFVRQAAAEALGKIGDPRAVEPLVRILQEATSAVQQTAAMALRSIGDEEAIGSLLEALRDWDVQWAARLRTLTVPLGGSGGDGEDEGERAASRLPSLQDIEDAQTVLPQVRALNDKEDVVRSAAWALGQLGDARAVEALIAALARNEPWETGRRAVAQALDSIGDAQVGFGPGELSPSARLLGALQGNAALEALRVVTVAQTLGSIGDPRAVPALVSLLQDKDGSVRQAAAEALTALGRQLRNGISPSPQ